MGNAAGLTGQLRTCINASGTDIPAFIRVKISGVKVEGQIPVAIASAADGSLGSWITQQVIPANSAASGTMLDVKTPGNQMVTMSAGATAGTAVDLDDNGKYKTTVGSPVGVSEDTISVAGYALVTLYA